MKYKVVTKSVPMDTIDLGNMYFHGWDLVTIASVKNQYGIIEYMYYFREVKNTQHESK